MTFRSGGKHGDSQFAWSMSCSWGQWSPETTQTSDTTTPSSRTDTGCSNEGVKASHNISFKSTPVCLKPHFYSLLAR